jgi:hypothetical protein
MPDRMPALVKQIMTGLRYRYASLIRFAPQSLSPSSKPRQQNVQKPPKLEVNQRIYCGGWPIV